MTTRTRSGQRPTGFTMLELLVTVAIGAGVLLGVWIFFCATVTSSFATDRKLSGVHSALLLAHTLERDLRCLHESRQRPLRVERRPGGLRLSFLRYARPGEGASGPMPLVEVTYAFDEASGRVLRIQGRRRARLGGGFESLRASVQVTGAAGGDEAAGGRGTAVVFSCVTLPEGARTVAASRRRTPDRTVLRSAAPLYRSGSRIAYPSWNEIRYLPPRGRRD